MNFLLTISTMLYILAGLAVESHQRPRRSQHEDADLDFSALAKKYGYESQDYNITTEDGYILTLFHIPGNKKKPVLLTHGFIDSSDSFILRGRRALAPVLAENGYDVWIANFRGNKYSRRHERLNPDTDKEFWNFSFHEMGAVDLPALIDFILKENNVRNLSLIGHSQGNAVFYVLGSTRPEYNKKINVAIALAPVCFLNSENYRFPLSSILVMGNMINELLLDSNQEEIFGRDSALEPFRKNICSQKEFGYQICAEGIFAQVGGEDMEELDPDMFYSVIGHYPTSSSRRNALHLLQVAMRREFAQFDYGKRKNLELYKSKVPPQYDLSKVTMKVALFTSKNDKLAPLKNVEILKDKLSNVVLYKVMEREKYNHVDHIWGKHMYKYLFPHLINLLNKYNIQNSQL